MLYRSCNMKIPHPLANVKGMASIFDKKLYIEARQCKENYELFGVIILWWVDLVREDPLIRISILVRVFTGSTLVSLSVTAVHRISRSCRDCRLT